MSVIVTRGAMPPPPGAVLLYEAEWNEDATAAEHADAVRYFAARDGVALPADAPIGALTDADAVWVIA